MDNESCYCSKVFETHCQRYALNGSNSKVRHFEKSLNIETQLPVWSVNQDGSIRSLSHISFADKTFKQKATNFHYFQTVCTISHCRISEKLFLTNDIQQC